MLLNFLTILKTDENVNIYFQSSQQTNEDESMNNSMVIDEETKKEPTHYSKLDVKKMKVCHLMT
jgi:hypothetical protein